MNLKKGLKNQFILLDGAMGTMLQQHGLDTGQIPEIHNILHPNIIIDIHKKYIDAGADIITANTFGANELKLKDSGYSVEEIISAAIENGKKAAGDKLVALDIGPLGSLLRPMGQLTFDEAYNIFKRLVLAGDKAGADLILIETIGDIYEARAAILAAKENSSLPLLCTMTFQDNERTLSGTDPLTMVNIIQGLGVDAIGVNCSLGPRDMLPIVKDIVTYSKIPVIVQPNAGLPKIVEDKTIYDLDKETFAQYISDMAQMGVTIFGGCCGTTPEYIREIKKNISLLIPVNNKTKDLIAVSSSTKTITIGDETRIVGERINPSGKDELKEALRKRNIGHILREAQEQKKHGADILDVNLGLPDINEEELMEEVVLRLQESIDIPLQIDSINPKAVERAVRIYNGRAIINSVNGQLSSMEEVFPIAKKYGALVIGLTLDENGIPQKAEDRLKIAEKIIKMAEIYDIPRDNIIIDSLVLTVSSQQEDVMESIKAVPLIKEKLQVKTILGISNISYGLPAREILNRTYLAMALSNGLDLCIVDPLDKGTTDTIVAFKAISGQDKGSEGYIKRFAKESSINNLRDRDSHIDLNKAILDGIEEDAIKETVKLLNNISPLEIIDNYLVPTLDQIGESYEREEIFLPQLIKAADTVKASFNVIKEHLEKTGQKGLSKGKVLIATVKGDIHDIGKNIAKILLENYGFEVIDLGKDVSKEDIIHRVKEDNIRLVGLSALMTTTVGSMEETIKGLKSEGLSCKVMVGGAVINKEYADMIGADYYAKDARDAVKIAKEVFL